LSKIQQEILERYYDELAKSDEISPSTVAELKKLLASDKVKSTDLVAAFSKEAEVDDSD